VNAIVKKIHTYAGLLSFSILVVFGVVGVWAALRPAPEQRPRPVVVERDVPYTPPPNITDRELADDVWRAINAPLTAPVPEAGVRRNRDNNLALLFFSPNGVWRVTVFEKENRLRVAQTRNRFAQYLNALHETTIRSRAPDWRLRLWTYYNEFSVWTLSLMAISGVWLWLSSRPGYRWAQFAFATGAASFAVLYFLAR
jgi:hypothetical protein